MLCDTGSPGNEIMELFSPLPEKQHAFSRRPWLENKGNAVPGLPHIGLGRIHMRRGAAARGRDIALVT